MGQLLACGCFGNNLAQKWHLSTEKFKHFLAAAQKVQHQPPGARSVNHNEVSDSQAFSI